MKEKYAQFIQQQAHYLSFAIALVATVGSLYFSEVMGYQPCVFCWYIRILMYPLVIVFGIAAVRQDVKQYIYALPLVIIGIGMSLYLYLIQKVPGLAAVGTATCGDIPCNTTYINWFGFVTIPFLALFAFVLILIIQLSLWLTSRGHSTPE